MRHRVLISPADSRIIYKLHGENIDTVLTQGIDELIDYERYHADMAMLVIDNTAFISESSRYLYDIIKPDYNNVVICKELGGKYPENVLLNAALVGKRLMCRYDSIAEEIKEYCHKNGIKIINVKQGYAKCSTLIVDDNSIITADKGIYRAAEENGIKALLISEGSIELSADTHGFIGGASAEIGDRIVFFGDIESHPDADIITDFIGKRNTRYVSLIKDRKLKDIGGAIELK